MAAPAGRDQAPEEVGVEALFALLALIFLIGVPSFAIWAFVRTSGLRRDIGVLFDEVHDPASGPPVDSGSSAP